MAEVSTAAFDPTRVDTLLRFVLAVAAEEDELRDRELGPIHLLKYLYLADLAYAERHAGETYTGASWRFHHFGPWSQEVFQRIEPALQSADAEAKRMSSRYADDFTRYRLAGYDAEQIRSEAERVLPMLVQSTLSRAIHEFGSDTASLLRHVYRSAPMVNAAPEEVLDFATAVRETREVYTSSVNEPLVRANKRERQRRMNEIREEVQRRLSKRQPLTPPSLGPAPRYDDVFAAGVQWLDELAGAPVPPAAGELTIDQSVWKSQARREPDVP